MKQVEAIAGFEHYGRRKRGDQFEVSDQHAKALEQSRLVRILGEGPTEQNPSTASGEKSSASPAVQVSKPRTSKPSAGGKKQAKPERSS